MFNLIEKIEDWFAWRAYKREYEEKSRKELDDRLRKRVPLWMHRLEEYGARDSRELGWVIGEEHISRYEYYKHRSYPQTITEDPL